MSFAYAASCARGRGGCSVRLFVRVSAVSHVGEDEELEVVVLERELLEALERCASGAGASMPCSVNAGTQRSVTSAITPSAPSPTRAARKISGSRSCEHTSVEPSASTSVSSATCAEMLRSRAPVPCVAVEIAPAMLCTSMSPRFSIARPYVASRRLSSRIVMPACTRTRLPSSDRRRARREPIEPHQQPLAARDLAEGMPRAGRRAPAAAARRALDRRRRAPRSSAGCSIAAGCSADRRPSCAIGGALVLIVRLAHQMTEPEPTADPEQFAPLARARCRRPAQGARRSSARAPSARRWPCCWPAAACARRCRRAPPSRRARSRSSARTPRICPGSSCPRSCGSSRPRPASRAPTTCSSPCPRAGSAR